MGRMGAALSSSQLCCKSMIAHLVVSAFLLACLEKKDWAWGLFLNMAAKFHEATYRWVSQYIAPGMEKTYWGCA